MVQWQVGAETDASLFTRLGEALRTCGYRLDATTWGVGGSQALTCWTVVGPAGTLQVKAETYMGLCVHGDAALVHAVQEAFLARAGAVSSGETPTARGPT